MRGGAMLLLLLHCARAAAVVNCARAAPGAGERPHVVMLLTDDVGHNNVGFSARHAAATIPGTYDSFEGTWTNYTPHLDTLARSGVLLERHYAYFTCTPSRQSILSGRLPTQMGVLLGDLDTWDGGTNASWGYEGLPLNVTTVGHKLKAAGYKTHLVGKADGLGVATQSHAATSRGFDTFFGFYSHSNGAYKFDTPRDTAGPGHPLCPDDWGPKAPYAIDLFNGSSSDTASGQQAYWAYERYLAIYDDYPDGDRPREDFFSDPDQSGYEEVLFMDRAVEIIEQHDALTPLALLFWSRAAHTHLELPDETFDSVAAAWCDHNPGCKDKDGTCMINRKLGQTLLHGLRYGQCALPERIAHLGMVHIFDEQVGRLVSALGQKGMWQDTLIIYTNDNGGAIGTTAGANNYPLRGGKGGDFDGGFRVPAFISGGFVQRTVLRKGAGRVSSVVSHVADWYSTLSYLAGVDPTDDSVGVQPVSSVNLWPSIAFPTSCPEARWELQLSTQALLARKGGEDDPAWYKLISGMTSFDMHMGPEYPNASCPIGIGGNRSSWFPPDCRPWNPAPFGGRGTLPKDCSEGTKLGCLFRISDDPTEHRDLNDPGAGGDVEAAISVGMRRRLDELNRGYFEPWRGCHRSEYCNATVNFWSKAVDFPFSGPFIDVAECKECASTSAHRHRTWNECQCEETIWSCLRDNFMDGKLCRWVDGGCTLSKEAARFTYPERLLAERDMLPDAEHNYFYRRKIREAAV